MLDARLDDDSSHRYVRLISSPEVCCESRLLSYFPIRLSDASYLDISFVLIIELLYLWST
jgi:hypothetical protein